VELIRMDVTSDPTNTILRALVTADIPIIMVQFRYISYEMPCDWAVFEALSVSLPSDLHTSSVRLTIVLTARGGLHRYVIDGGYAESFFNFDIEYAIRRVQAN